MAFTNGSILLMMKDDGELQAGQRVVVVFRALSKNDEDIYLVKDMEGEQHLIGGKNAVVLSGNTLYLYELAVVISPDGKLEIGDLVRITGLFDNNPTKAVVVQTEDGHNYVVNERMLIPYRLLKPRIVDLVTKIVGEME